VIKMNIENKKTVEPELDPLWWCLINH